MQHYNKVLLAECYDRAYGPKWKQWQKCTLTIYLILKWALHSITLLYKVSLQMNSYQKDDIYLTKH